LVVGKRWKSKESRARAQAGRGFVPVKLWRAMRAARSAVHELEEDMPTPMRWESLRVADRDAKPDDRLEAFPTRPSRYAGSCGRCKARFAVGDPILWLGKGKVWCQACCAPR
jgi:hypothetical protein